MAALWIAVIGSARMAAQSSGLPAAQATDMVVVNYADADSKPVMLSSPRPAYPPDLRIAGIEGSAVVDFVVDPNGVPTRLKIYRQTNAEFGSAAMASVAQWRFSPGRKNGSPAWVHIQIPIVFSVDRDPPKGESRPLPPMADIAPGEMVYDISKVSVPPVATFQARPEYPPSLKASGASGRTTISFIVRASGRVSNVTVVKATDPLFGAAGVEAVKKWTFRPARAGGQVVNCHLWVPLVFTLKP
jgi:TonB family protein